MMASAGTPLLVSAVGGDDAPHAPAVATAARQIEAFAADGLVYARTWRAKFQPRYCGCWLQIARRCLAGISNSEGGGTAYLRNARFRGTQCWRERVGSMDIDSCLG
jgi:hypothetical protein